MPFVKGQSGNPKGREKGNLNKTTAELKTTISAIINTHFNVDTIEADLLSLEPKQRLDFMLRLIDFVLPKPRAIGEEKGSSPTQTYNHEDVMQRLVAAAKKRDEECRRISESHGSTNS